MSNYTPGTWKYFRNADDTFSVFPAEALDNGYVHTLIAEIFTDGITDPEANARLIASAPELKIALVGAVEALRATEVFMCAQGLDTEELNAVIEIIDGLLDRIDGSPETEDF